MWYTYLHTKEISIKSDENVNAVIMIMLQKTLLSLIVIIECLPQINCKHVFISYAFILSCNCKAIIGFGLPQLYLFCS